RPNAQPSKLRWRTDAPEQVHCGGETVPRIHLLRPDSLARLGAFPCVFPHDSTRANRTNVNPDRTLGAPPSPRTATEADRSHLCPCDRTISSTRPLRRCQPQTSLRLASR